MISDGLGVLALWHDCAAEHHAEFEHWYQTEHLFERLALPGFLRGRRYVSCGDGPGFFTYYETHNTQALQSAEYLQRLNHPTDMTRQVMSGMFTNMSRTICQVTERCGRFRSSFAYTVELRDIPTPDVSGPVLSRLAADISVARAELWQAVGHSGEPSTEEETMRGGDSNISACLLIETLRESDLQAVAEPISQALGSDIVKSGFYQLLCELESNN